MKNQAGKKKFASGVKKNTKVNQKTLSLRETIIILPLSSIQSVMNLT